MNFVLRRHTMERKHFLSQIRINKEQEAKLRWNAALICLALLLGLFLCQAFFTAISVHAEGVQQLSNARDGFQKALSQEPEIAQSAFVSASEAECPLAKDVSRAGSDAEVKWERTRKWCDLIVEAASKYFLDVHLLAAVIWWESGGDPQAYSTSGAVGLMQVMPRDGPAAEFRCANGPCFADRPTIEELQNPAFNINYGSNLLREKIDAGGSIRDGLRLYGPKEVGYYYADKILGLYEQIRP